MPSSLKRLGVVALRTVAGALVLVLVLASGRALFSGTSAEASAQRYYPAFCLGGWQKARLAAGAPQVPEGASTGAFTIDNSAFLSADVSAQIFCGYFPVERTERQPLSATAHFVWSFNEPPKAPAPAAVEEALPAETTDAVAPESPASTEGSDGSDANHAAPAESEPQAPTAPAEAAPESTGESPAPAAEAATPSAEPSPTATPSPEPAPAPAPEPAPAPSPEPAPAPAPSEPTSVIDRAVDAIARFAAPSVAHAQEVETVPETISLSDVLEIRYSIDGVTWQSAGRVSRDNWYNYTVALPIHSWDDMENLQVMVVALPSLEERPAIYLESVGLSVEVDRTLGEVVEDGMETVAEVAEAIIEAPEQIAGALAALLSGEPDEAKQEVPAVEEEKTTGVAKRLSYAIPSGTRVALALPQAVSNAFLADDVTNLPAPDVSVGDDGAALTVAGYCRKPYFVVLTFRNAEDYANNPRAFVANYAGTCTDGRFSYEVTNIPLDTQPGTYYLVIGEQEGEGSWVPVSSPIPVEIQTVLE